MSDLAGSNGQRKVFHVVGRPNLPGKLSYSLATGKAKFGSDCVVDNMLHAKFLRSPYANGVVKNIDISRAKALLGVVDIILKTRSGNAAYGANGTSHSLTTTHLVICAIANAIGKWIDPPATPDKVLKTLGKA